MGIDCKGCLVTDNKDVFKIVQAVNDGLKELMRKESGLTGFAVFRSEDYKHPKAELFLSCESISLQFTYKDEPRDLSIHFGCDRDLTNHPEIEGTSCIWFSLGCWGSSEQLMHTILKSVSQYGKIYIDVNDCDDVDFQEI